MNALIKKINNTPLIFVIFSLFLFFLPFQEKYYKPLRPLTKLAFKGQFIPPYFFDRVLDFYLTDFLLLAMILIGFLSLKKSFQAIFWDKSQKYLTLFLFFSLISIFFSSASNQLWPYWRWIQLALPAITYFVLVRELEIKKVIHICFWILFWVSLFQCIVTILQYHFQHSIGLKHLGENTIHFHYSAKIYVKSKHRWIFDSLFHASALSENILRPYGTFPHPNLLGGFLGMTIFSTSYLFLQARKKIEQLFIGLCISLFIFTLALTYSRGGIFGVVGSFFLLMGFLLKRKEWRPLGFKLILPFTIGAILCITILHEQFIYRGGIVNSTEVSKGSDSSRLFFQKTAFKLAKKHPLFGLGWNQYLTEVAKYDLESPQFMIQRVHNIYLLILVESGLLGLLSFLGFLFSLLYWTWKNGVDLISATLSTILIFFLWFGCVDHFLITMQHGKEMFFLILALLGSHVLKTSEEENFVKMAKLNSGFN